jgi:small subunit ribosomal protein S21
MGLRMRVHEREPIGAALRRFKKLIERSGVKREIRAHEYYEKPCEARRRKEASRLRAMKKAASLPRTV